MSLFWIVLRQLAQIEAMATSKKLITREEWEKKLSDVKIKKEDMNKLVMNFLVTEGFVDVAEKFRMESGTEPDIDLATISDRMAVKKAVQSGNVEDAIDKVNDLNPEILDTNPQLFFHLQQQRLIELIRNGKVEEALEFAQEELAPRGEENIAFLEELERTVALLAFEDVTNCPVGDLLDISQRLKTASEVNAAILTSQSHEKGTQRRHSARVILQKLRRNISDDVITIDVESNEKGGKESVIKRNTRSNKEVIIQQQKKDSTGVKNVAETTSDDDFQTPPRKSLKTVVQKRLPNKVDERPKKKQKENNDKGKNKGGQKQKIEQRDKIISKEDEIAKIRNSPRLLCDMISALSDEQEEWVKSAGFGSLVDFELWEIPQRLAYKVLEAFDEKKCMLVLQSGKIKIIDHLVHEILGLPCRGHEVKLAQGDSRYDRLLEWREQFSVSEGQSLIKASDVVEKMRQSGAVDDLFKINFLVVMANVLIRSNTNNFVAQSIISFDDDLDNCAKYNWASYLIRSLVITKQRWKRTSSLFYTGPMIFLLILYVDRVVFNINTKVPRKQPAFRGWTKEKLKEREVMELEPGAFGSGTILRDATPQQSNQTHKSAKERVEDDRQAEIEEIFAEQNNNGDDHPGVDNHPCGNDQPGGDDQPDDITEDWWETLNVKAALLMDANIQLMEAKNKYDAELAIAKNLYPDDERIADMEAKVNTAMETNKNWMESASNLEDLVDDEHVSLGEVRDEPIEQVDLPPDADDHLDIIAWLKSPEGIKEFEKDFDDFDYPSFSLGISQICQQVQEEHGELETRKEQMEPEKKTKRDIKVGPAYRSPYVQRNTNIISHYSRQEIAVYRWMIQEGKDELENIFVCKEQKFLRKVIRTLRPGKKLSYSVIDIWSILMNDRENYKSPDSPMRLYFDIGFSIGPLDEKNSEEAQYQMFKSEMEHFFNRYPNIRFEGSDLLFFPVYANRHFYLVCFNLMKQAFEVIDNIRQGKNAGKYYGPRIRLLRRHFEKYLLENNLSLLANLVKNLKPSYLVMPWQTIQNDTDCGLFLMRHMETYMGDAKTWTSDLKPENYGQTRQLDKIRAKYCHAILASPLNEIRQKILDEAKLLYNKMASERVMSIVIEASKRKGARVHGKKMIKGRVLFDED